MTTNFERGECGLVYATDPDESAVFVAAPDHRIAIQCVEQVKRALLTGNNIELHILHDHENGKKVSVPTPEWMTGEQRNETVERMQRHLRERMME